MIYSYLREVVDGPQVLAADGCLQFDEVCHGSAATGQGQKLPVRIPRYHRFAINREASDAYGKDRRRKWEWTQAEGWGGEGLLV